MVKIRRLCLLFVLSTDRLPLHLLMMESFAFCCTVSMARLGHVLLELANVKIMYNAINSNVIEVRYIEIRHCSKTLSCLHR